jgi:hypothetical protein
LIHTSTMRHCKPLPPLLVFLFALESVSSFNIAPTIERYSNRVVALDAQKKLSMAEKRKRRGKRLPPKPLDDLPPSNLDFKSKPQQAENEEGSLVVDEAARSDTEDATTTKAQRLLQSQRESVAMLTAVRECVEKLPAANIQTALDAQGYWYCDDFLKDAAVLVAGRGVIDQMSTEGVALLQTEGMAQDVSNLGSGEYVCNLQGGNDQYVVSPRSIEWVVAVTKHLATHLVFKQPAQLLSTSNCMANMRTFDRKALLASLALLTGQNDVETMEVSRPFATIVQDERSDLRRLSLFYYLVSSDWETTAGGGITFEKTGENVHAKRDRLVILKSDTTAVRQEFWKGREDLPYASCIELHLVVHTTKQ